MRKQKLPSLTDPIVGSMPTSSFPPGAITDATLIEPLFDDAFAHAPDSEFLSSLYNWWEEKDFLTREQFIALSKFTGSDSRELDFDNDPNA